MHRTIFGLLLFFGLPTIQAADATGWWPPFVPNVPVPAASAAPNPTKGNQDEELILTDAECAGISGFRTDWDRPIPLAADGDITWREADKPGSIVCDAVHRSLLVRFPSAANRLTEALKSGKSVVRAELSLTFRKAEVYPSHYRQPAGMSFLGDLWEKQEPTWHVVAWALNQPWIADRTVGPTYNAYINGAGYWSGFGARTNGHDRNETFFGPTPLGKAAPEARVDITASLADATFGGDLGSRLRRFSDCGFIVRKWEAYDAAFWGGGYEWGTATGARGLVMETPRLVVHLKQGKSQTVTLPPAADVRGLAGKLAGGSGGKPTAVFPTADEFTTWSKHYGQTRPERLDPAGWQRLQDLWKLDTNGHGFPATYEAYVAKMDELLATAPRYWGGFDAAEMGAIGLRYRDALPLPVIEHLRLYWWAWLMPDRESSELVQGYIGHDLAQAYYSKTHDWRGNFSVYRTYCRDMGTMNFNHWASAGTLFGGALLESPRLIAEGGIGLSQWPLKTWTWYDGSTQESIDHYYLSHSLSSQLPFAALSPTSDQRLMGQAILAKSVGELALAYHPRLKRFTSSSSRTGVAYPLFIQDGVSHIMHTIMPGGAMTDLDTPTVGDGIPTIGHDFSPALAATLALDAPWAPAWYGTAVLNKPIPYQMTSTYKKWGSYSSTPLWKRTFQGRDYGVASLDISDQETIPFLVHWRAGEEPVTSSRQLGMLIGRFGINRTELLDSVYHGITKLNPNGVVGNEGGTTCAVQDGNRLIVLTSPIKGLVADAVLRPRPDQITSIQTTLGLITLHQNWTLTLDGKPVQPPCKAKAGQRLVIADGSAYVGIIALPGTDLGRDVEVEITADGVPTIMQGGGKLAEALRINAYLYHGKPLAQEEWSSERIDRAWGGFCIQAGDASEFKSAMSFDQHLAAGSLKANWDEKKHQVAIDWTLGGRALAATFVPEAGIGQPTTNLFPSRTLNGKWLYLDPGVDRECDLSAIGSTGSFTKNGAVFTGEAGRMGYLFTDPVQGIYEAWNPYPEPGSLALSIPGGARIESAGRVSITRFTVSAKGAVVAIDGALPGKGRATTAILTGFPKNVTVILNGTVIVPAADTLDGKPVLLVPLDGGTADSKRLGAEIQGLREAQAASKGIDPANTCIARWWLAKSFPGDLNIILPPERGAIDLKASYSGGIDGAPVTWEHSASAQPFGPGFIGFGAGNNRVAYAYTTVVSERDQEVQFYAGSDDGIVMWVNGAEVWRNDTYRGAELDQDSFPGHLHKGANHILLKISQGIGGWQFCLRIADRFGLPVTAGITVPE